MCGHAVRAAGPKISKSPPRSLPSASKWMRAESTRHGFALNVNPDMRYWDGIIACGLADEPVASLADLLSPPPAMDRVKQEIVICI